MKNKWLQKIYTEQILRAELRKYFSYREAKILKKK